MLCNNNNIILTKVLAAIATVVDSSTQLSKVGRQLVMNHTVVPK